MARFIGTILILVGVAFVSRIGFVMLDPAPLPPSLCGCEFDEVLKREEPTQSVSACCAGVLGIIAGILMSRRHRLGAPWVVAWFATMASIPWVYELHSSRSSIDRFTVFF